MQDNVQREVAAWQSQLRKGSLELAVLLALRRRRQYGLELVDLLNQANLGISDGSIYPLLSRLRAEMAIPMKAVSNSDFIPVTSSGLMPVTLGAKRRWRIDLDRSDRHPSTNALRRGARGFVRRRDRCCCC